MSRDETLTATAFEGEPDQGVGAESRRRGRVAGAALGAALVVVSAFMLAAGSACDESGNRARPQQSGSAGGPAEATEAAAEAEASAARTATTAPSAATQPRGASADGGADPATAAAGPPERLFGTWVAHDVATSAGPVKVQVTFRQEGPVRIIAWSELPLIGQVRETKGPYEVNGHTITSEAIRGGTSVQYWFQDDGQLVIKYADGKTVAFHRQ